MPALETDPIDLRLDADGDLYLSDGLELAFTSGKEAVAQSIALALELFAASGGDGDPTDPDFKEGEWFFDLDAGTRWWDVLGERYDEARARAVVRETIEAVPNVKSIETMTVAFDAESRELSIRWRVSTVFGNVAGQTGLEF